MATTTTRLALSKPALTDTADITAPNPNWDTLDNASVLGTSAKKTTVSVTTQQTILTYTPTVDQQVLVCFDLQVSNTGSATPKLVFDFTDANSGTAKDIYGNIYSADGTSILPLNASVLANGAYSGHPIAIFVKANTTLSIFYTDAVATPSDVITVSIVRVN